MKIKSWKENKILIALLIALVVIGSIVMNNFLSFLHIRDLIIDQIKENQDIKTKHAADSIENHIKLVQEELVTLSQFPLMEPLESPALPVPTLYGSRCYPQHVLS